jgi:hypothetical protein
MIQNTNNQLFNKIILKIIELCNSHVAEKNQNATAAPDAVKGSGLANVVRAAPANAEQRLLKFSASVSDKNNCASPS